MNPYKKLISDTFIFAIGTFSSKALVFFMIPIYTRVLSSSDYGVVDLIVNTCNLLIPIVSAGIANAVMRFGLERGSDKRAVFSIGIITCLIGIAVMPIISPVLSKFEMMSQYTIYIYLYVGVSCLHAVCAQFTRSIGYLKLYAFDGLLRTILTIGLNVLLMVVFQYGIIGYLAANIISDIIAIVFLMAAARLNRYFKLKSINKATLFGMLRYSIPLIPTTISIWIINISNRYIITYFLGTHANGLYAVSYKIPTLIIIVSTIFMDAWQISAVSSQSKAMRERFFSNVLYVYQSLIFVAGSAIIMLSKTIMDILAAKSYFSAWQYIPPLVIATSFMCFSIFLGSVYMVEKKSGYTLITTFGGALANVVLNFALIPMIGVQGAAVSMIISYMGIFAARAFHTRKFLRIKWHLPKLFVNLLLLSVQCVVMLEEPSQWMLYEAVLFSVTVLINFKILLTGLKKVI